MADELGVTRDVVNAEIKAGRFAPADVVVGDRFQGWSRETVDLIVQDRGAGVILCDAGGVHEVMLQLRGAAEVVRAYGYSRGNADRSLYVAIPRGLLMQAARLDSEMRRVTVLDHTMARVIHNTANDENALRVDEETVPFEAAAVAGVLTPVSVTDDVRARRLRDAAATIAAMVVALPECLKSDEARGVMRELGMLRDRIAEHADIFAARSTTLT